MQHVILFDLGGVLINWNDNWLYDEISTQLKQPFNQIKTKFNDTLCSLFESKINEGEFWDIVLGPDNTCLLYTSPSPRDRQKSRMPSSA